MRINRLACALGLCFALGWPLVAATAPSPPALSAEQLAVLRHGEVSQLHDLLDQGVHVNSRDASGNTLLHYAAAYSTLPALQLLLERGAEVNATNFAGATPLLRAAIDPDKIALLLKHDAQVNLRSALGNSALILAARPAESHRSVEMLLARGADAHATNQWGATALMAAAAGGDADTVRLLLKAGANPNAQPGASHEAFILGGGRSALMWAAYRGDLTVIQLLLEAGADVNGVGLLGTPLTQATWADHTAAARLLMDRGAKLDLSGPMDGYTPLHWAASSERSNASLVQLLLSRGADPNAEGGAPVDAFLGTAQTPLMLAQRRGDTPILAALREGGATKATLDRGRTPGWNTGHPASTPDSATVLQAINRALAPLQKTSLESKQNYVRHASRQDCTSCHQQFLPMAALGLAKKQHASYDRSAEDQLIKMVLAGDLQNAEPDWEALFHPDPVFTKGYALLGCAAEDVPSNATLDAWVHHLSAIQGKDGQWHNNLPRPPIQSDDIGATALAVHALQRYPLPGRKAEFAARVERARAWLWAVQPDNTEGRIYQLLGLAWAGESDTKLQALAEKVLADQRPDGGWAQLAGLKSDAYATGQAVYALRTAAHLNKSHPALERGLRFLLDTQLDDGTWYVRRRAFPFQPTMDSGFPHGRDSWISAAASSWAVMALSAYQNAGKLASN